MLVKPKNNFKKLLSISRDLRKKQTETELIVWKIVRNRNLLNLKFSRQKVFGEFVADFYCAELKLILEIDGNIHNELKERDKYREDYLKIGFGITILRYKNELILEKGYLDFSDYLENEIRTHPWPLSKHIFSKKYV